MQPQPLGFAHHPDHRRIVGVMPLIVGMQLDAPEPRFGELFEFAFGLGGVGMDRAETDDPTVPPVYLFGEPVDRRRLIGAGRDGEVHAEGNVLAQSEPFEIVERPRSALRLRSARLRERRDRRGSDLVGEYVGVKIDQTHLVPRFLLPRPEEKKIPISSISYPT